MVYGLTLLSYSLWWITESPQDIFTPKLKAICLRRLCICCEIEIFPLRVSWYFLQNNNNCHAFCKCIMKNASTKPLSGAFLDLPLLSVRAHVINVWLSPTRYPEPGRDWRIFRRVIQINCNPWGYTWGWGGDGNWKKLNHALKFDKWGFNFSSEILNAEILGFSVPSFIICKTRETSPNTSLSQ